jgi:hypothetical protein
VILGHLGLVEKQKSRNSKYVGGSGVESMPDLVAMGQSCR